MRKNIIIDSIIIFVIIIFLKFFSLTLIPEDSPLGTAIHALGLILAAAAIYFLLFQARSGLLWIDKLILVFTLTFLLSACMANIYWDQSFFSSLSSSYYFDIFFLYFILLSLQVSEKRIERIILIFFFITLVVFLIDFVTFPDPLFAWRSEERRGGSTVFFFGQGFTFLGAFYFLEQFFKRKKPLPLLLFILSFYFLFFLTQARMMLVALVLGTSFLFLKSDLKHKYLITFFLIFGMFLAYNKSELFNGIKEQNETEAEYYKDNIRLESEKYYLFDLQGGIPTMLFGNGIAGKDSKLGNMQEDAEFQGYFQSDVGITGIYSYFGLLGAIIWILFFFVVFKSKDNNYIKAYFLTLLTTVITGYSLFSPGYMPATVFALYLVRMKDYSEGDHYLISKVTN